MVKIQKPTPKTLSKTKNLDKGMKKKSSDFGKNAKKLVSDIGQKPLKKLKDNDLVTENMGFLKEKKSKKHLASEEPPKVLVLKEKKVKSLKMKNDVENENSEMQTNKKKKKPGLPPPPTPSPSPSPEPKKEKIKHAGKAKATKLEIEPALGIDKTKGKAKGGLPTPPTPSPEPVKEKKSGKAKIKAGLPPPPTPSPEPKKSKKSEKVKIESSFLTPPPSPVKDFGKGKAKVALEPTKGKGKKEKKPGATVAAPLVKVEAKKKASKAKSKKALTGKQAYDKKKQLKKAKLMKEKKFTPVEYSEDKFDCIVNEHNIEKIAEALKIQAEAEIGKKKASIFTDYRFLLNVAAFKIPNCPKRMVKLNLKHSMVDGDDDVVIVVADLQRGAKVDYEATIHHYEDLFRDNDIKGLKIMPFNQLRQECNTFEAVRKFGNSYDYFLADGRIVGHVVGFCGKIFQKPRTTFHSVHMSKGNMKAAIEKALKRTAYKQLQKGDLISIPIANHKHSAKEVAENAAYVIQQLKETYPGGLENVRGIHLKIDLTGTSSLPIYMSLGKAPDATPYLVGPKEKRMLKLRKEANDILANFKLSKDGDLNKLSKTEALRKKKIKEAKAALLAAGGKENEPKPEEADGEESIVPAKKPRKDDVDNDVNKKSVESNNADEEDDDEDGSDDGDDQEGDDDEDEGGADDDDDTDPEEADDDVDDEEDEENEDDDDDEDDNEDDDEDDDEEDDDDE